MGIDPTQAGQGQQFDPHVMQKLISILTSRGGGGQAGQMAPSAPQSPSTPGRVGQVPNVTQTPNIVWDPKTAIGNQPAPAGQQQTGAPSYKPDEGMSQAMMQHLDPKGAATFSAIQGVGQILSQWSEKKQKNQASEASNIASNLMTALDQKDMAQVTAIMSDPKSMKILNKVYKGWLTKAQDAQRPKEPEKVDPDIAAFEKGIADYTGKKVDSQQQQQQQSQQQQQQMPRSIGGYMIPQAGPAQQMKSQTESAQAQYARQDPESAISGPMTPQRVQQEEILQAKMEEAKSKAVEAYQKSQAAAQGVQKAELVFKQTIQKGLNDSQKQDFDIEKAKTQAGTSRQQYLKALTNADIEKTKLQIAFENLQNTRARGQNIKDKVKEGKKLPIKEQERLYSIDRAQSLLESLQKRGGDITKSDAEDLAAVYQAAGANGLAKSIPGMFSQKLPSWLGGSPEAVNDLVKSTADFKSGIEKTADERFPGWRGEDGKKKVTPAPADEKAEGDEEEGDEAEEEIDLTN